MELLLPEERSLVKATLINRFRGDIELLNPLPEMIAERTGVPVAGIIPFVYDLQVKEEDGVTFGDYDPPVLPRIGGVRGGDMRRATKLFDDARSYNARGAESFDDERDQTPITIGVVGLPRVSNHDDLDPFRRAGCRIRIITNPHELTTAQIIIIPGSKSTIADLRWMKSRGLDKAIIEAANRGVTVVGICGGYQILGEQLDDPDATESPNPDSETGLGLLPTKTVFDTVKTTRRVNVEIPAHKTGPLKGEQAHGIGYEIHTGITTGTADSLAKLTDDNSPNSFSLKEKARLRGNENSANNSQNRDDEKCHPETLEGRQTSQQHLVSSKPRPDGTTSQTLSIIGTYVHGIFDSPEILRRLLNTTAETHNLPKPVIQELSMEAEYDRLAQITRENLDMNLINSLLE